jgi:triphosphoribosyl-dephospho-CoA synthase
MISSQIAAALEVSATPKPGNVHRYLDYEGTKYEHFLAGAIALGPSIRGIAERGVKLGRKEIEYEELGIGHFLSEAISDMRKWHRGGNTHLGISMLFIPLSAAAGIHFQKSQDFKILTLRGEVKKVISSTTANDTKLFYTAISSLNLGWLGNLDADDLLDMSSRGKTSIINTKITFYELMQSSKDWDGIARELANGLDLVFNIGYPTLMKTFNETGDINISTVNTYLTILSQSPDTFIARKIGLEKTSNIQEATEIGMYKAVEISERAKEIVDDYGGLTTQKGKEEINKLDTELRNRQNPINPGTTADITAASIMITLLSGFRF